MAGVPPSGVPAFVWEVQPTRQANPQEVPSSVQLCRLATITGRPPAGVSLCPDVHCPAETRHLGHCRSSFLLNLHSLIWLPQGHRHNSRPNSFRNRRPRLGNARPFHPTPLPSLFLEPGLVHVCIPKAANKLCLERKVLRVLPSSKLKTSPARERQF